MADTHSRLGEELLIAVNKGDGKDRIEYLLEKKADVNYKNVRGQFPLLYACRSGSKEIVECLIDGGAQVNLVGNHGMTALSLASEHGHHEIVEILVDKGAIVDHPVEDGRTPLMLAAQNGQTCTVDLLLQKGAKVDLRNSNKYTALMLASSNGHDKVVEKLLEKGGAKIGLRTSDGHTSLILATEEGHARVVEVLLNHNAEVDVSLHRTRETALMIASKNSNVELVELLLRGRGESEKSSNEQKKAIKSRTANVNCEKWNGSTALCFACSGGNIRLVQILIEHSAEVNPKTRETPLYRATKHGHTDVVEFLLKKNADPNVSHPKNSIYYNTPPLILATVLEHTEIVKLLLKYKANVDEVFTNGQNQQLVTPLMCAIFAGHLELVQLLCDHGADIHLESTPKHNYHSQPTVFTSEDVANATEDHKIIDILKSTQSDVKVQTSCSFNDEEIRGPPTKRVKTTSSSFDDRPNQDTARKIMQLVKEEYQAICSTSQIYSQDYYTRTRTSHPNLSDLLPEVADPIPQVDSPTKPKGLSTSSVCKVLVPEAANWEMIGALLDVEDGILKKIEANYTNDSNKRLLEMVRVWLNMTKPPPTWKDLADAVGRLGNQQLSKEILEKEKIFSQRLK